MNCFRTAAAVVTRQTVIGWVHGCEALWGERRCSAHVPVFGCAEGVAHGVGSQTLDKWLQDPEAIVPDSDMAFRLEDKAERTAIIEYLKDSDHTDAMRGRQRALRSSPLRSQMKR